MYFEYILYVGEQQTIKAQNLENQKQNKNSYLRALILVVASSKIIELCTCGENHRVKILELYCEMSKHRKRIFEL